MNIARMIATGLLGGGAAPVIPWYLAAGVTPIGAYLGIGAINQAGSYINLANPGTYDLTASGAGVTWNANGWKNAGAYLETGITNTYPITIIARVKDWNGGGAAFGTSLSGAAWSPQKTGTPTTCVLSDPYSEIADKGMTNGYGAVSMGSHVNGIGYVNGESVLTGMFMTQNGTVRIVPNTSYGYVCAVAVYGAGLTQTQIQAIGTRMMALP